MSEAAAKAFDLFTADIGNDEGTGEWFEVTQAQIDQFIHVDPVTANAELKGNMVEITRSFTIEIEGEEKPGQSTPSARRSMSTPFRTRG